MIDFRGLGLPTALLLAFSLAQSCGGSTDNAPSPKPKDGGSDAGPDAAQDAGPDATPDAPVDAPPDTTNPDGALGSACDGTGTNPDSCQTGLSCYQGTDQGDSADRWPGGYCTKHCTSSSQCADVGGVCSGGFGFGRCFPVCNGPTDCRQGYACIPTGFGGNGALACAPTGFIATRGPGEACFQHTDPNAAHYTPALAQNHFSPNEQFDSPYPSSNEVALALDDAGHIVTGANALSNGGYDNPAWYGATASTPLNLTNSLGPKDSSPAYSDPYLVSGAGPTFYYSTLGINFSGDARVLVGKSTDFGATWTTTQANPASDCTPSSGNGEVCLDHPWLAIGPDKLDTTKEALYAAYLATRANDVATVLIRSTDGGATWGIPGAPGQSLAVFSLNDNALLANLITPAVDDQGVVHMVASVAVNAPQGSTANSIQYARSEDGGQTHTPPQRINPQTQAVPYEQPAIVVDNGKIFVAYITGHPDGAWDVYLAQSADNGQNWTGEQVNDEPEECATHFHVSLAVDRATHKLYVGWYDGRFAPYEGSVAMAVCDPSATGKQCGPNEAISDATFYITTDRNGREFIGDYFTLAALPNGNVWAGFGDTRQNYSSHSYVAHGTFP
jgi:hypothetical protein